MNAYYNLAGIGDTLMIPFKDGVRYEIETKSNGDVTKITNTSGEVLGYNLFNASKYIQLEESGKVKLVDSMITSIEAAFKKNGVEDQLNIDFSPKFIVGYVTEKAPHENADKLNVCQVDVGSEKLQIVCGAPNVDVGQKVVVAKIGATMPSGLLIKPTKLRGLASNGMICSQKELEIPNAPEEKGIYILEDLYDIGSPFEI